MSILVILLMSVPILFVSVLTTATHLRMAPRYEENRRRVVARTAPKTNLEVIVSEYMARDAFDPTSTLTLLLATDALEDPFAARGPISPADAILAEMFPPGMMTVHGVAASGAMITAREAQQKISSLHRYANMPIVALSELEVAHAQLQIERMKIQDEIAQVKRKVEKVAVQQYKDVGWQDGYNVDPL